MKKNYFFVLCFLLAFAFCANAQSRIIGNVRSDKDSDALFGVKVIYASADEKIYYDQTFTDVVGNFALKAKVESGKLIFKMLGYRTAYQFVDMKGGTTDVGMVYMEQQLVNEITDASALVDLAVFRKSPLSSATLMENDNFNHNTNKDFVERFSPISGIYTTTLGGGYSDGQMRMRGYDQSNLTPIIDGIAVNDVETGLFSWNSTAPIADAFSSLQLQKGLGASKLVNASVAGTVNMNLKDPFLDNGNFIGLASGNNDYRKMWGNFSLGNISKGFGLNLTLSNTTGLGYVPSTDFNASGYYLSMGYLLDKHRIVFKLLGAPQWHNQRKRLDNLYNVVSNEGLLNSNYNSNQGLYKDNTLNLYTQTSHLPFSTLEWQYNVTNKSILSLKAYTQLGFSSQKDFAGDIQYFANTPFRNSDGTINFDYIEAYNQGRAYNFDSDGAYLRTLSLLSNGDTLYLNSSDFNKRSKGISLIENLRKQQTFGALANYQVSITKALKINSGFDFRKTALNNTRYLNHLLGADGYKINRNFNNFYTTDTFEAKSNLWNPFVKLNQNKVDYDNVNNVVYGGVYSQVELNLNKLNFLLQGGYNRNEYYKFSNDLITNENFESNRVKLDGYNVKLGFNWNINSKHNVWVNAGKVSRTPIFNYVFDTYNLNSSSKYKNEDFEALEVGYTYLNKRLNINVTGYLNSLTNSSAPYEDSTFGFWGVTEAINKLNYGVELDAIFKPLKYIDFTANASYGSWKYKGNAKFIDLTNTDPSSPNAVATLFVDGLYTGGAPQFMAAAGFDFKPFKGFSWKLNAKYHDLFYSNTPADQYDPFVWYKSSYQVSSLQLPDFTLLDTAVSYQLNLKNEHSIQVGLSMNNVLNSLYITESNTSYANDDLIPDYGSTFGQVFPQTFKNVNNVNTAWFGLGRTWNFAIQYKF